MPITPFHGGIGLACKGPLSRHFSFTIFVVTQVVIDLESAYFLLTRQYPVHRFLHTFIGAGIACLAVALLARPLCEWALRLCAAELGDDRPRWLDLSPRITLRTALLSATTGLVGHVIPDSIMHADARPFAPFSDANPMLGAVSLLDLHRGLIVAGVIGMAWIALRSPRRAA